MILVSCVWLIAGLAAASQQSGPPLSVPALQTPLAPGIQAPAPLVHAGDRPGFELTYPSQLAARLESGPVVDIGTGRGQIAAWTAAHGFKALGLDRNADYLAATPHAPGLAFAAAELGQGLPIVEASAAGAMLHRTLSAIPHEGTRKTVLGELARVLKPGGWASILDFRRVEPDDEHGDWYQKRYAQARRLIPELIRRGVISADHAWLADSQTAPTMVLRDASGATVDGTAYPSDEALLGDIDAGRVRVLFVSAQMPRDGLRDAVLTTGLEIVDEWEVQLPHSSGRKEYLQGVLARKKL